MTKVKATEREFNGQVISWLNEAKEQSAEYSEDDAVDVDGPHAAEGEIGDTA